MDGEKLLLAAVTGGNTGVGFEIVKALARDGRFRVIMCVKSLRRGHAALERLRAEGLTAEVIQVDISEPTSVHNLEILIEGTNGGVLDVMVNNAAVAFKASKFGDKEAELTMKTNFYGTMDVTDRVMEYLRASSDGRLINVCCQSARLGQLPPFLQERFRGPLVTRQSLTETINGYVGSISTGQYRERGWPLSFYAVSKMAEVTHTLMVAREEAIAKTGVIVNAMCPGWCATELTGFKGIYSAREGASTAVFLATAPRESLCPPSDPIRAYSGRFYVNCAPCLEFERDWAGAMPLQRGETPSSVRPFTESPAGTVFTRSTAATPYPTTTPMPDTVNSPDMRSDSASAATGKS